MTTDASKRAGSVRDAAGGKALRDRVPRSSHSAWTAPDGREDAIAILDRAADGRVAMLVPIRNARMAQSPFAFFRGAAAVMAHDLAGSPVTGLRVQACGDAHCLNFGGFATPERRLVFDVNDFDETLPAPWEWDVKRLVTSIVLAARQNAFPDGAARAAATATVRSYRQHMQRFSELSVLGMWYQRIDLRAVLADTDPGERKRRRAVTDDAETRSARALAEKITELTPAGRRFKDEPPKMYHPQDAGDGGFDVHAIFASYRESLTPPVRSLFDRFTLVDTAIRVVGIGSVGTRCAIALFVARDDDFLVLQIKEAVPSVLEQFAGASEYAHHGERVVMGQRLMQVSSDVLLGWGSADGHDFYVRQFQDFKTAEDIRALDRYALREYGEFCGWALASGHARSGDAAAIAGYLGRGDVFDKGLVRFAFHYADQTQRDYEAFVHGIESGRIPAAEQTVVT